MIRDKNRLTLQIISGSCGTECYASDVFLLLRHVLVYAFGELPGAHNQQARRQGIQRPCMTYFLCADQPPQFPDYVKRCPVQRLIDQQHLSLLENVQFFLHRPQR